MPIPRNILLTSNCFQFTRTVKLDVGCVYLLTFGGFLSYPSLEHPWIQQKFFSSWASFDKTFYHLPPLSTLSLTSFSKPRSCTETLHKHYISIHTVHSIPKFKELHVIPLPSLSLLLAYSVLLVQKPLCTSKHSHCPSHKLVRFNYTL